LDKDKEKIELLKKYYIEQKREFLSIDDSIVKIMFNKIENIYLEFSHSRDFDYELEYKDQKNDQKIYNITLLFIDFIVNEFDYDYNVEIYDEISLMKSSLFTRNSIRNADIRNIDFNLLNFEQIKEIFYIIGPEKTISKIGYILEKINDETICEKLFKYVKFNGILISELILLLLLSYRFNVIIKYLGNFKIFLSILAFTRL
jgi:hypothetical protein